MICEIKFKTEDYQYWVDRYIELSKENGERISSQKLSKFGLPYHLWYVDNCYDESVTNWNDFMNWCGFPNTFSYPSKEVLCSYIKEMQSCYDRPLMQTDFKKRKGFHEVSLKLVLKVWGSFNNMKEECELDKSGHNGIYLDLIGEKIGYVTVIKKECDSSQNRNIRWLCRCDCGNEVSLLTISMRENHNISCGCMDKKRTVWKPKIDLTNKKFGKLTVIEPIENCVSLKGINITRWKCKCECGNYTNVRTGNLISGHTKSCGCLVVYSPIDGMSLGERTISKKLNELNIKYISEYTNPNLTSNSGYPLRVDFCLPDYNTWIEFDGEQHFFPVSFGSETEEETFYKFNKRIENDEIKDEYCKTHNINMVRIPYWDYDKIDEYLSKIIS